MASTVATVAWYNIVDISRISNLNFIFENDDSLFEMTLLDQNGEVIKNDDGSINYGPYTNSELGITEETKLDNVSGMYENVWLNENTAMEEAYPTFRSAYRYGGSHQCTDDATGGYTLEGHQNGYVQNVFILKANVDCSIYLSDHTSLVPDYDTNETIARRTGVNADDLNQAAKAARLSFFSNDGYTIVKTEDEVTNYGGVLDLDLNGYYDSRSGKEVLYGEYDESQLVYEGVGQSEEPMETKNTFISHHQKDINMVKDEDKIVKKENSKTISSLIYNEETWMHGSDLPEPICKLRANEEKRLVVSLYIEGWDIHAIDSIQLACFDMSIGFVALLNDPFNSNN